MKGAAPALAASQKRGGWRALPVLALVVLSMLVPLLFLLNQSGYLEDDRGSRAWFERYDLKERRDEHETDESEKEERVNNLIKQFEPKFHKDIVEILEKEPENEKVKDNSIGIVSDSNISTSSYESTSTSDVIPPLESSASDNSVQSEGSRTTDGLVNVPADENEKPCQSEFGSYCIWRDEHKEQMKDSVVKKLKDQLFVARAYYPSIAKIPSQSKLTHEMKINIQDYERMLSEATTDADLPPFMEKKIERMDNIIAKAKAFHVECSNVDKKFRQILDLMEDEAHFHMKQSAFLYQLAVQTMPKSLHCLSMRLTVEYFRLHDTELELFRSQDKQDEPFLYHFVIFSKHILAASVAINSTVMHSKESGNQVFHVITDAQNYVAMKHWFYRNAYGNASIDVVNVEDLQINMYNLMDVEQHLLPSEFTVSVEGRTDYISLFGSAHFLLPDLFPKLNRIIILDEDVVVQHDLSNLFYLDMQGKVNGAVQHCGLRLGQLKSQLRENNFDYNSCVWMSGLNVVDLEKWREHNLTQIYLKFLELVPSGMEDSDSSKSFRANLLTFEGLTFPLDSSWALQGLGHSYGIGLESIEQAFVLHYNGVMKPWLEIGIEEYKRHWQKFLKRNDQIMDDCNVNS